MSVRHEITIRSLSQMLACLSVSMKLIDLDYFGNNPDIVTSIIEMKKRYCYYAIIPDKCNPENTSRALNHLSIVCALVNKAQLELPVNENCQQQVLLKSVYFQFLQIEKLFLEIT